MKSVRLSNQIREQILNQMMQSYKQMSPSPKSKQDASNEAFEALWQNAFGKYDFTTIPEDFLKKDNKLSAIFDGTFVRFDHSRKKYPVMDDSYNPVPVKTFEKLPKFYTDYLKSVERFEKWQSDFKEFKSELESILFSCGTSKQLLDIWPQSEVYLPNGIAEIQTKNLPALKTSELNKKLGINS